MIDVFAILDDFKRRTGRVTRELSFIELNRSAGPDPALALLVFEDGDLSPVAFVKAVAGAGKARRLRQEFENLSLLQQRGTAEFCGSVPRPLYLAEVGEFLALAESTTPGARMKDLPPDAYFRSERFARHFDAVVRWLGSLGQVVQGDGLLPDAAKSVARYRTAYRVSPALDRLLETSAERLASPEFSCPPGHGDFCTANVLIADDDRLFVVDWEYPLSRGWPLADLLYFIASTWCIPYEKGPEALERNYRRLFFEPHRFSERIESALTAYATRLGLAADLLLSVSVLSWVAYANRKHEELLGGVDGTYMPLIMIRDDACLNLELLAENRERYLLSPAT